MRFLSLAIITAGLLACSVYAQSPAALGGASGINVASVPECAKVCLSNSTQYATGCAQIDVSCLCDSPSYVSALSCCLATNCDAADQQTAIQFNVQECSAVNATAPNFVGCSPFSLTTGSSNPRTSSSSTSQNTGATTLTGALATIPTAYTETQIGTASFDGSALLTGSCTIPLFAQITQNAGDIVQFPQVGCALNRGDCCPYDPKDYAGVTKCPSDYATISGACCPNGYSLYSTALGAETPCYSSATKTYLPATTPTEANVNLITNAVFSRRYVLLKPGKRPLAAGAIAGLSIGALFLAACPFIILWLLRRWRRKQAAQTAEANRESGATFPPIEPTLTPQMSEAPNTSILSPTTTHELASPQPSTALYKTTPFHALTSHSPAPSSPPAYEMPAQSAIPFEMPGSTYIHEHYPMYTGSSTDVSHAHTAPQSPPRTPPRSPAQTASSTRSPVLSPASPFRSESPADGGSFVITPLGSPRPGLMGSPGTRFREQM